MWEISRPWDVPDYVWKLKPQTQQAGAPPSKADQPVRNQKRFIKWPSNKHVSVTLASTGP